MTFFCLEYHCKTNYLFYQFILRLILRSHKMSILSLIFRISIFATQIVQFRIYKSETKMCHLDIIIHNLVWTQECLPNAKIWKLFSHFGYENSGKCETKMCLLDIIIHNLIWTEECLPDAKI